MRRSRNTQALAAAAVTSFMMAACGVEMDLPDPTPPADPQVTVDATTAAPGTQITVEATGFDPDTQVNIGMGMPASDFDVIAQATTDQAGRVQTTVQIPDWTMRGHAYVVVVDQPDQAPRAVSDPFVVGGGGDEVAVTGTLTDEGVECPSMRGPQGTLYTLAVTDLEYEPGAEVYVEGRIAEAAICMQGTTIEVQSIQRR